MEAGNIAQWGALLVSALVLAFQVLTYRSKANAERVEKLEKAVADKASAGRVGALEERVDKVEDRTTSIEGELRHLPDKDVSHRLELGLERLTGQMAAMDEKLKPVAAMVNRVHQQMFREVVSK